jgi:hypothetical protein
MIHQHQEDSDGPQTSRSGIRPPALVDFEFMLAMQKGARSCKHNFSPSSKRGQAWVIDRKRILSNDTKIGADRHKQCGNQ